MRFSVTYHVVERRHHNVAEMFVHYRFFPEVALSILHPFEIGSGDTTRVCEDVRNYEDSLFGEDIVGGSSGRSVRALSENLALHSVGVLARNLIFGCGRY